jgi:hypothetical protein
MKDPSSGTRGKNACSGMEPLVHCQHAAKSAFMISETSTKTHSFFACDIERAYEYC